MTDSKAKNTDDDVAKANSFDECCGILLGLEVVVTSQRDEESIYDDREFEAQHRKDLADSQSSHDSKLSID